MMSTNPINISTPKINNPRDASEYAANSRTTFIKHLDDASESRKRAEEYRVKFEENQKPGSKGDGLFWGQRMVSETRDAVEQEMSADVRTAVDKKTVADNLDSFKLAAIADAALDGVHIQLQQAEDSGQQIEVHTSKQP